MHIRLLEGKTTEEHRVIMEEVLDRLLTSEEELLPQHRHLVDLDFGRLGEGTTVDRQYWLANLDSAVKAAAHRSRTTALETRHSEARDINEIAEVVNT